MPIFIIKNDSAARNNWLIVLLHCQRSEDNESQSYIKLPARNE